MVRPGGVTNRFGHSPTRSTGGEGDVCVFSSWWKPVLHCTREIWRGWLGDRAFHSRTRVSASDQMWDCRCGMGGRHNSTYIGDHVRHSLHSSLLFFFFFFSLFFWANRDYRRKRWITARNSSQQGTGIPATVRPTTVAVLAHQEGKVSILGAVTVRWHRQSTTLSPHCVARPQGSFPHSFPHLSSRPSGDQCHCFHFTRL